MRDPLFLRLLLLDTYTVLFHFLFVASIFGNRIVPVRSGRIDTRRILSTTRAVR